MTPLELKKLKAQLSNVVSARMNLEVSVDERLEEIERLRQHIATQEKKEKELTDLINRG